MLHRLRKFRRSTCPENSQSGDTCASRISSTMSAVGSGGGVGDPADEGQRRQYRRVSRHRSVEAARDAFSRGGATGCASFACASMRVIRRASGDGWRGRSDRRCRRRRRRRSSRSRPRMHRELRGLPAPELRTAARSWRGIVVARRALAASRRSGDGHSLPAFRKNSPACGTIIFSPVN